MNQLANHHKLSVDEYVTFITEQQKQFSAALAAEDDSIYRARLGNPTEFPNHQEVPCCIYFYYVRINTDGRLYVTHHFYPSGDPNDINNPADPASWPPIPRDEVGLKNLIKQLAESARPNGGDQYRLRERDFVKLEWRRKSYVAIFVDEANWKLHKNADGKPCILFITEPKNGKVGTRNHTFFDAMDFDIDMQINGGPETDKRTAVVFINHMKSDEEGNDLGSGPGQYFQFKIYFDVAFASGVSGITVIFDPDETNLGPPVPPP
jgi:hypothetical protein